ncbi:MAG: CoB--CoM heterodisulfide reductase subunit B [Candidatus Bathyarchaeota archaeon]|nr:CoB--CoM heterodisulfide reductase subunit B [Candidatus Bathyarchaeota archaeon]MDH5712840.1 CoB--CoM heterodisulfide reductase subunit B [Candidatus Bathyarchaeota archaeon]
MKYAFFLGCIMPNRYPGLEAAMRNVTGALGIKLLDMEGASCCPPPGVVKSFHKPTWLAIAARNLTLAEALNVDATTLCSGCYGTLKEANMILKEDNAMREKANKILHEYGKEFHGTINVKHFVEVLYDDIGIEKLRDFVKRPLNLKVAVHYGCHLLKPTRYRTGKSSERPKFLDELVEVLGAKSIPYRDKMMCCGAGGGVRSTSRDVSADMTKEKLENVKNAGGDCIVTPCAFCHLQFDIGQIEVEKQFGVKYNIPTLHYVQLLGLALGLEPQKLGLYGNVIPVDPILKKL